MGPLPAHSLDSYLHRRQRKLETSGYGKYERTAHTHNPVCMGNERTSLGDESLFSLHFYIGTLLVPLALTYWPTIVKEELSRQSAVLSARQPPYRVKQIATSGKENTSCWGEGEGGTEKQRARGSVATRVARNKVSVATWRRNKVYRGNTRRQPVSSYLGTLGDHWPSTASHIGTNALLLVTNTILYGLLLTPSDGPFSSEPSP